MGLQAPAKINLNLLVDPPRADGFHPLDSMVAKITLYDSIELRPRSDGQIVLTSSGCDCGPPEQNLVMRAAQLIGSRRDHCGVDIKLTKVIPAGSGLGGGSSDAAATLRGLNEMWALGLDAVQLSALASELGSDVPLFLGPPAARITGRGECVERLEVSEFSAVILTGPLVCSTAEVYGVYDQLAAKTSRQLDAGLFSQGPPSLWRGRLANDLTEAAERVCGELATLRNRVQSAVDIPVHLSGSGSAMFMLCDDSTEAQRVVAGLDEDLQNMCVIVGRNPW
jgi:4-diphosphocytidyl-2-C-methyl-D-erythritol kinase